MQALRARHRYDKNKRCSYAGSTAYLKFIIFLVNYKPFVLSSLYPDVKMDTMKIMKQVKPIQKVVDMMKHLAYPKL